MEHISSIQREREGGGKGGKELERGRNGKREGERASERETER